MRQRPEQRARLRWEKAPPEWLDGDDAKPVADRFHLRFSDRLVLTRDELLFAESAAAAFVRVLDAQPALALGPEFATLREVANSVQKDAAARSRYRDALLNVLQACAPEIGPLVADPSWAVIAPEREGHSLAEAMGWNPSGRFFSPHMKRIHCGSGLAVGMAGDGFEWPGASRANWLIVDGAIASGSTISGVLAKAPRGLGRCEIVSVHATESGIARIAKTAMLMELEQCHVTVGRVTGVLNDHYYAVDPLDESVLEIGDIGDTICEG